MSIEFRNVGFDPIAELNVSAPAGAIIGVVGVKGSGVQELLKLAAGAAQPTQGEIIAGAHRRFISPGETLNLAPADVIALDQALAMQDALVRSRSLIALDRLRRAGSTILLASHEERLLEALSDEIWWFSEGRLRSKGDPREVLGHYRNWLSSQMRSWGETLPPRLAPSSRRGDGRAQVLNIETLGADGRPTVVWRNGEQVAVRTTIQFDQEVAEPVIGIMIRTQIGFEVYGTNTELEKIAAGGCAPGDHLTVTFCFRCDLCPQSYTITIASHDPDGSVHDWLDDALAIEVVADRFTAGVADLRAKVQLERAATSPAPAP
jgi:ABC-type branched-subunit amino acid transport system ATPase component